jgi:rubrerythrin
MSILFSGSELLEIALGIERNGAAFYQALADKTKNKNAKAIYEHLASEERKHLNTFQGMLNTLGQYQPPESHAEEYMLYLKSLVDSSVFSNVTEAQQKAEKISGEIEALDTGIQAEKDSILFYTEMLNFVRQPDHKVVINIIDEEKAHLRQLSQLKQTLQKSG